MNLKETNIFKKRLYSILSDLDKFKDTVSILETGIDKKLNRSLDNYISNLNQNIKYLLSRSTYQVLKAIEKETLKNNE